MRLARKVALITGGTSGIGKATSLLFAREGAKIAVSGRNEGRGQDVVKEITAAGGEAVFISTDVRSTDECRRTVEETVDAFGRIDILFNNAGVWYPNTVADCTEEEWDLTLDVNLKGAFLMSKYTIPKMVPQGGGHHHSQRLGVGPRGWSCRRCLLRLQGRHRTADQSHGHRPCH
jgi:NAD(P)-dependent dehydrogenase (short-subunit alcohol dehydrogenase family)